MNDSPDLAANLRDSLRRLRTAPQEAPMSDPRERLGRLVRDTWVKWARNQPNPKPSWLVGWYELDSGQREVDMRIGEAVANAVRTELTAQVDGAICKARAELAELDQRVEDLRAFEREYRSRLLVYLQNQVKDLQEGR